MHSKSVKTIIIDFEMASFEVLSDGVNIRKSKDVLSTYVG